MSERQHWLARWIDWARRGHWLWSLFPSTWKALIWGLVVGIAGALIASISKRAGLYGWVGFLCFVLTYAVIWAIVQTTAKRLSAGAGRLVAHGEVRHPFQITDRDPKITIDFDKSSQPTGLSSRPFRLRNDGGTDAYKVQFQIIVLVAGYAEFREIPQVRREQSEIAEVQILDPTRREPFSGVPVHDFEMLLEAEGCRRCDAGELSPLELKCYITYQDHADRHFITHLTLCHDLATHVVSTKDYKFFELKLAKASRFLFLRR